jgi:ribosomal protein L6P/L9E
MYVGLISRSELLQTPEAITVESKSEDRRPRQQHGLCRSLISNMVTGVSEGFDKHLELQGVGYRAALNNETLSLSIGLRYAGVTRVSLIISPICAARNMSSTCSAAEWGAHATGCVAPCSSPVEVKAPYGIKVSLLNPTNILIHGIDKQQVRRY